MAVTADSSTEVVKRKEALPTGQGIRRPKWVGAGGRAGPWFLLTEKLQSPEAKPPSEASGGLPGLLGHFCKAF